MGVPQVGGGILLPLFPTPEEKSKPFGKAQEIVIQQLRLSEDIGNRHAAFHPQEPGIILAPEVKIDEHHPVFLPGKLFRQINGHGGFPLPGHAAGD